MTGFTTPTRLVVGFAGRSKSGKTRLSTQFAAAIDAGLASFGNLVRTLAQERQLDPLDPRILLSLGSTLVNDECEWFCRRVLTVAGWPNVDTVILDGIRHTKVVNMIKTLISPAEFRLVVVTASLESRLGRFHRAIPNSVITLGEIDAHAVSNDSDELRRTADFTADGDQADSKIINALTALVIDWRQSNTKQHE